MPKPTNAFGAHRKFLLSAAALAVAGTFIIFNNASATPNRVQSQSQDFSGYVYEVVSVKPSNPASPRGTMNTPDGYTASNTEPMIFIHYAFGILNEEQVAGAPGWAFSEKFNIDAKMDPAVADAFQKLSPDDRKLARQHMLQVLLADRFKLRVHVESRELSIYTLVIAKSGFKMKDARPDDNPGARMRDSQGRALLNAMNMTGNAAGTTWASQATSIPALAQLLSRQVGRIIVDKTGLTGTYEFQMQFSRDDGATQAASGGASPLPSSDSTAPSLFTALQEQLGLKLESGKGPVDVTVIDHIERPSGN